MHLISITMQLRSLLSTHALFNLYLKSSFRQHRSEILSFIEQLKLILIFKCLVECKGGHDIYLADSYF